MNRGEIWWDDSSKRNFESLRERFNILGNSPYASPRITMTNGSVAMVVGKAPSIFMAIVFGAIGIITPLFINMNFGPLEGLDFIILGIVMIAFSGTGVFLLMLHFRGDKLLFIHENHLELRHEKSKRGIPEEYKHILLSDVVKIISHERVTESTDHDGSISTSVNQVTSILVYNADEPESRTNQELCLCMTDIYSSTKEESDAIATALNFLILIMPPPSSVK